MHCRLPLLVLALAAGPAAAQGFGQVGPPTFETSVLLDLQPGGRPPLVAIVVDTGWNGVGASGASGGVAGGPVPQLPTPRAEAESTDARLRADALASGITQFSAGATPTLHAHALARNTRYWQAGTVDWTLDFLPILDGRLDGRISYAELPGPMWARVDFRLDVVDLAGALVQPIFGVSARIDRVGGANELRLSRSVSGAASPLAWEQAFTDVTPPGSFESLLFQDLAYFENLIGAYTATASSVFGLRWTLETEALVQGTAVAAAMTADFGHTAQLAFQLSDGAPPAAALTELLVLPPPVPEPGSAALLLAGLGWMFQRRRSRARRALASARAGA